MAKTLTQRRPSQLFGTRRFALTMLLPLAFVGFAAPPASAQLRVGSTLAGHQTGVLTSGPCGGGPQILSFTAIPSRVQLGEWTTLSWNLGNTPSADCPVWMRVNGQLVGSQTTLSVQPFVNGDGGTYQLTVTWGFTPENRRDAITAVAVDLPLEDPLCATRNAVLAQPQVCRHAVTINQSYQVPLLIKALGTSNTTVGVAVDLELSGPAAVVIADGVTLIGGRQAAPGVPYQPGPRIHTATAAVPAMFSTEGSNVRISGVRLEGPGLVDGYTRAIQIAPGPDAPLSALRSTTTRSSTGTQLGWTFRILITRSWW